MTWKKHFFEQRHRTARPKCPSAFEFFFLLQNEFARRAVTLLSLYCFDGSRNDLSFGPIGKGLGWKSWFMSTINQEWFRKQVKQEKDRTLEIEMKLSLMPDRFCQRL